MHAILSTKAVWAAAKDAEVDEKVRIASMIARKSQGDIKICCRDGAKVLGPVVSKGTGGTGDAEEVSEACGGAVTIGAMDTGIWGSSTGTAGCG